MSYWIYKDRLSVFDVLVERIACFDGIADWIESHGGTITGNTEDYAEKEILESANGNDGSSVYGYGNGCGYGNGYGSGLSDGSGDGYGCYGIGRSDGSGRDEGQYGIRPCYGIYGLAYDSGDGRGDGIDDGGYGT